MAQIKFDCDLTTAGFPLLSDWASRSVIVPQLDQGTERSATPKPQVIYAQDVLPTANGYKSISYQQLLAAPSPANTSFSFILTVSDSAQNRGLIGVTTDNKIYTFTIATNVWQDVSPVGWVGGDAVTTGSANGVVYILCANYGCYSVSLVTGLLTPVTLLGITIANIKGIFSSINYLCLYDSSTIYWSSTINPLDFVPSLITGAGSSVPYDLSGVIVSCVGLNNGFAVYSTTNIVLSSFSNNTQYPWIFRNANNGAGIRDKQNVTIGKDLGFHIAITYAGVLKITPQGCQPIVPEVSDFLAANLYESFNSATNTLAVTRLTAPLIYKLAVISARWIVVSYGITTLTDCLVYDLALNRWGKLHITHAAIFELEAQVANSNAGTYNAVGEIGSSYASAAGQLYNLFSYGLSHTPDINRVFGYLTTSGTIGIAYMDYVSSTDAAVLLLGKYQLVHNNMLELLGVEVESIPQDNTGFSVVDLVSLNGKDIYSRNTLVESANTGTTMRLYDANIVGKNHTLAFKGSFNLTNILVVGVAGSRR